MDEKKVYIPLSERLPNEVDGLETCIAEIQKNCSHDLRLVEEPKLRESNVQGVYIVHDAETDFSTQMTKLRCLHCSKEKQVPLTAICPWCLGEMRPDTFILERTAYFKNSYLYYVVRRHYCKNCRFAVVSDEWDQ